MEIERLANALSTSWSLESSTKWTKDTPSTGQCGVTALVVNDLLGGEIKKTYLPDGWHFYNCINNQRYDFTAAQFKEDILYMDILSNREDAYADTNEQQYHYLKQKVYGLLF